jgi:hypothetical protein
LTKVCYSESFVNTLKIVCIHCVLFWIIFEPQTNLQLICELQNNDPPRFADYFLWAPIRLPSPTSACAKLCWIASRGGYCYEHYTLCQKYVKFWCFSHRKYHPYGSQLRHKTVCVSQNNRNELQKISPLFWADVKGFRLPPPYSWID